MSSSRIHNDITLSQALRRIGGAMLGGLAQRFDLVSLEFLEEKQRLLGTLFLTLLTAFLAFLAFLCLNVLIIMLFWDTHRIMAVVAMTSVYLALAASCVLVVRHRLRHGPEPFAATLAELRRDAVALGGEEQ